VLEVSTPDVLHGITQTEVHVFSHLYRLNARRVRCVVLWVVYIVSHVFLSLLVERNSFLAMTTQDLSLLLLPYKHLCFDKFLRIVERSYGCKALL